MTMAEDLRADSVGITDTELARLMSILFEHHSSGRRSPPEVKLEYERLVQRLHALPDREFAAAIGSLGSVIYAWARDVAQWGERPLAEALSFLQLAATRRG